MALTRLGSLNALEQTQGNTFWQRWLSASLPSADTVGEVFTQVDLAGMRTTIKALYAKLKRNKVFKSSDPYGLVLIIDGHESSASYLRHCDGCLQRTLHTKDGDVTQNYHRLVSGMLYCESFYFLLDVEMQKPGEDEVTAAMRLLERILENYPRAFNLIIVDGLYVRAPFFKLGLKHGKEIMAVLKEERRELMQDVRGLFKIVPSIEYQTGKTKRTCWDIEDLTSWESLGRTVRVVRSLEETPVLRQLTKKIEIHKAEWIWVTTLSQKQLPTKSVVDIGHKRWAIENNEFNEIVNCWYADHVYRHHPVAIEAFWLMTMMAYNLFHAFIGLNLKPQIRYKFSKLHWAQMVKAEIYGIATQGPNLSWHPP
ncbi:MAG: transposase [Candidatus Omnitrophica bacterium]|nr:transposase [Candidatus Omnitrophota bacterium]